MNHNDRLKQGEKGAYLSISAYLLLSLSKIIIAQIGNSEALKADGLNNITDVMASIAVLIGLKISRKPPDQDHHYGHSRAESIASLVAAFIMITVGLDVIWNTMTKLAQGESATPDMITAYTALISAAIMFGVYRYNIYLSRKIESSSLHAQAQDNLSDTLVSLGAFTGILGAQFGLKWLDPLAGVVVGVIICKTAIDVFRDAAHTLTDGFDEEELHEIKKSISRVPGVSSTNDIKARKHGNQILMEVTIEVNPNLNVEESHKITEKVEEHLERHYGVTHAHIHIEPHSEKK
ncbi:cation diffusion facilitator family transporter [Melghiribacillus thermohalophilus]|uniref:Cation diffusion facilitator family transporter n=1 Tax=Melghiribacillus thermohalophilus TaxID=1324956 RepID=A0A4R3N682_9BACI|nr:cation diffusion facilitator family transporter [Melghiribacillus thermohalophilus]TCT23626.1 cation diffusion facilitator family transporter [Melghiribacillus thermohalophilus]